MNKTFERVYTIGCFDWFHFGHQNLFQRMRAMGHTLIVGIHDDNSIEKLKNLSPSDHQSLHLRIANIKPFCDIVFVIPDTDPSFYLHAVLRKSDSPANACYVRGNDMPNFPGRHIVENNISIQLLPYTLGISSSQIRAQNKQTL